MIEEVVGESKRKTGEEQMQRGVRLQRKNGRGDNEAGEKMHNISFLSKKKMQKCKNSLKVVGGGMSNR